MTRIDAIERANRYYDSGAFLRDLERRVALRSESQGDVAPELLRDYLDDLTPALDAMGFTVRMLDNAAPGAPPMLIAERHESSDLPTVLIYGHGDVVRGQADRWREGLSPWTIHVEGDRLYGRGTADNKGQHSINLGALQSVLATRGSLGFNAKLLIEMGEERGSPGLNETCARHAEELAADVLIASDGPRLQPDKPTIFLGSRGIMLIKLWLDLRQGAHHSGNWGGILRNPATTLAAAINHIVDADGVILVDAMRPPLAAASTRAALAALPVGGAPNDPMLDAGWGEPGMSPGERLFAWNSFDVLAMQSGDVENPIGAIPPTAVAHCQLRFVVGTDIDRIETQLRQRFDESGLTMVQLSVALGAPASRLDPDDPWARWTAASIERTTGKPAAVLPNFGGTLPNNVFSETLNLPTIWIPHSYAACAQHAPNEHLLGSVAREGLQIMAGLFWDLGEGGPYGGAAATDWDAPGGRHGYRGIEAWQR